MLNIYCNEYSEVRFAYTNYRGEESVRVVMPRRVYFGSTEHHREYVTRRRVLHLP